jgi:peptidoglycan/xylan/chitin deacetylase (PgdA/CDA1 family)
MQNLLRALDAAAEAGRPVRFWLRDDDAEVPSQPLGMLLDLCRGRVPLTLSVIPAGTGAALGEALAVEAGVSVAVHGWAHTNHAYPHEKARELGRHRPPEVVAGEVERGLARLTGLFPARIVPVLVPPWNRIAPDVVAALRGFRALSMFRSERPAALPMVNAQVDIIDWRGHRGGQDAGVLERRILARAYRRRPVGVLTHHLVHDAAAWRFLERLFDVTCGHPGAVWVPVMDLVAETTTVSTPP